MKVHRSLKNSFWMWINPSVCCRWILLQILNFEGLGYRCVTYVISFLSVVSQQSQSINSNCIGYVKSLMSKTYKSAAELLNNTDNNFKATKLCKVLQTTRNVHFYYKFWKQTSISNILVRENALYGGFYSEHLYLFPNMIATVHQKLRLRDGCPITHKLHGPTM